MTPFLQISLLQFGLLVLSGVLAGIVNTLAGGGSFLTLPALMALGLAPGMANGTNRIAVLVQTLLGSVLFHRQGQVDYRLLKRLALPLVVGSIFGAWLATRLDPQRFETAFGVLLILMGAVVALKPRLLGAKAPRFAFPNWLVFVGFLAIGVFAGFIQAGVGILLVSAMVLMLRVDPVVANGVKLAMVFMLTVPALAVFAVEGQVELVSGLVLSTGNALGAFLGVRIAVNVPRSLLLAAIALVAGVTGLVLIW